MSWFLNPERTQILFLLYYDCLWVWDTNIQQYIIKLSVTVRIKKWGNYNPLEVVVRGSDPPLQGGEKIVNDLTVPLNMKGCICHFAKCQIRHFISKGTLSGWLWIPIHPLAFEALTSYTLIAGVFMRGSIKGLTRIWWIRNCVCWGFYRTYRFIPCLLPQVYNGNVDTRSCQTVLMLFWRFFASNYDEYIHCRFLII